jgi:predicted outer membrane repeat protein
VQLSHDIVDHALTHVWRWLFGLACVCACVRVFVSRIQFVISVGRSFIFHNVFRNNRASSQGGGISIQTSVQKDPIYCRNCTFMYAAAAAVLLLCGLCIELLFALLLVQ